MRTMHTVSRGLPNACRHCTRWRCPRVRGSSTSPNSLQAIARASQPAPARAHQERAVLEPQADRRLAELALHPRERTLCHNDVHHRNIIDGRALMLIDWEYAAVGDPMFDLASFACYHDLDAAERLHLIESYAPRAAAVLAQSFDNYCWLFDYMHLLWLELTASDTVACARWCCDLQASTRRRCAFSSGVGRRMGSGKSGLAMFAGTPLPSKVSEREAGRRHGPSGGRLLFERAPPHPPSELLM